MSACSSVDLPEPVLPATRACWAVPRPRLIDCRRVAPARPTGTSNPFEALAFHTSSGFGAMYSNGTSTRTASRLALPTRCTSFATASVSGGRSSASGNGASAGSFGGNALSFQARVKLTASRSPMLKSRGMRHARVGTHQRADAARWPARCDADEPLRGLGREVRSGKFAITSTRYGSATSPAASVVLLDRLVLVPQVLLDHAGDVIGQVREPLLDVRRLGPDLRSDQLLVVIGEVHERGEVLAEADRVDDREPHLARRQPGEEAEHHGLKRSDGGGAALVASAEQDRAAIGEGEERGDRPGEFFRRREARFGLGMPSGMAFRSTR